MEELLKVEDVAVKLGSTRMGVYGLVFKNQIPALKISKRCLRFRSSDIEKWLDKKGQKGNGQRKKKGGN